MSPSQTRYRALFCIRVRTTLHWRPRIGAPAHVRARDERTTVPMCTAYFERIADGAVLQTSVLATEPFESFS